MKVLKGDPDPAFPLLFHDNPASRTSVFSNPNTVFFPSSVSPAKISVNTASRVAAKSHIKARGLSFSRMPHFISAN